MVMSQGTATFVACFSGFWLVWALVVTLCCFCNVLQRRLKRRGEARPRESSLRTAETPGCPAVSALAEAPGESQAFSLRPVPLRAHRPLPEGRQVTLAGVPDPEESGNPPCYEEAVLMEDPPPPYALVSKEPPGGVGFFKDTPLPEASPESRKPPFTFPERGYSSLVRWLPSQPRDPSGRFGSGGDPKPDDRRPPGGFTATLPRRDAGRGLGPGFSGRVGGPECARGLPAAFALLGRSTAV
ncbi:proline-rich protein 7 [Corythoichthys intestinalis]|uniref:proline-rich protein 7 n=1 Tax=Corythoichthys intestinalis TaxID=161448 RepID=UPI0025A51C89|nr:proline-rich protein 7 [Corythoichthys intestinalis]XP_061801135.1 proline-rich protein 7-like [Nerophis lumbriciformis]